MTRSMWNDLERVLWFVNCTHAFSFCFCFCFCFCSPRVQIPRNGCPDSRCRKETDDAKQASQVIGLYGDWYAFFFLPPQDCNSRRLYFRLCRARSYIETKSRRPIQSSNHEKLNCAWIMIEAWWVIKEHSKTMKSQFCPSSPLILHLCICLELFISR